MSGKQSIDVVYERVQLRLQEDEPPLDGSILLDYVKTAIDRITIRLGSEELPEIMESIAVDVVVKMVRRRYYEGIASESTEFSTSFVENILAEYETEFEQYLKHHSDKVVRFL